MHRTPARESLAGISRAALATALLSALACAQLLDLPSEPALVAEESATPDGSSSGSPRPELPTAPAAPPDPVRVATSGPPLVDATSDPGSPPPTALGAIDETLDAGATSRPDADPGPPPTVACTAAPVDIVMIIDNSGSMVTTSRQAEVALPSFALRLEQADVDYRIILISRHRSAERIAGAAASTSICVASPLGGLPSCPGPAPALTSRFFQYSVKIDATDSLQRVLEAASTPDMFGLTSVGWLEWLRPGARVEFVEVTDADTEVAPDAFVSGLATLAPEHFSATSTAPGFVFHAITGVARSPGTGDIYAPDDPIQSQLCTRLEGNPDNAGEGYQALSRATGGLRQPVCPATALTARMNVIASAIIAGAGGVARGPEEGNLGCSFE